MQNLDSAGAGATESSAPPSPLHSARGRQQSPVQLVQAIIRSDEHGGADDDDDSDFDVEAEIKAELQRMTTASDGESDVGKDTGRPTSTRVSSRSASRSANRPKIVLPALDDDEDEEDAGPAAPIPSWTEFLATIRRRESEVMAQQLKIDQDVRRLRNSISSRRESVVGRSADGSAATAAAAAAAAANAQSLATSADAKPSSAEEQDESPMWEEDYSDEEFGELPVNVKATVEATNDRVKVNVVTASLPVPDLDELSDNETEANPLLEKEQRDLDDRLQELHDSFSSEDSLLEKLRQETLAFKKPASSDVGDDASSAISKRKKPTVKPRIKRTSSSSLHDLNDAFPESFGGVSRSQSALDISQLSSVTPAPNDEAQSMNDKPASREGAEKDGLDESASIIGTAAEEDPNEDYEQYKKEELRLKAEYQSLQKSLKTELEQQEKLSVQLESASSAVSIQRRALRATKMKVRDMQEQQRQLLHWFKVVAKVAFEKEKDKANALLQRAMRILSRCTTRHDKIYAKVQAANQRLEAELEELNRVMAEHEELRDVEARLTAEVDELKLTLEREEADYLARRENVENDLKNRLLAEEALRKFEAELIAEACEKQRPGRPVDVDELDVFEAVKREVKKIPNLRNATRLTHISFENNQITSARGLEHLSNLISINLNQNKLQLLDVSPFEDVRFLSAASNALTSVQGLEKCKELVMLDLSSNPIENLSSFGEAENLQVVDLHSTKIQDYKWIERLAVLIYLDLSRTKMMDTSLEFLHSCPILQFLNLSRNGFTAIPPIYNILLRSLSFEGNFLKRLSVTTWLPRLRVLNISNNKIQHIEPLTLCPLLEELYLASNEIQEKASLFSISACTCLRVLDLTKNPISTVSDFHPIVFLLFPRLQLLNGNPTTGNAHATTPLKAIRVLEACLQLFEEGADTLADDCSPQQILEQWDDFRRICFNHQSKIDEFMGEEYEPYLKYLSCSKGQQPSKEVVMRMRMQENRMSWLGGLLQPLLLEMEDLGKNTPVGARAFLENVMVEELLWRKEEQGVILLQSCWRRRAAKKAAARRSRAIRVIQLWMRSILIKRGKIILNPLQLRGIVQMQAIWRGFMARKKKTEMVENALKEADALLRDTSMTDWISRAKDNIFDDEMRDYLGHERLRHFSAEVGSRERRQSSLKPGGIALRDSGARDSTAVDEIEVSLTQEAMEPIWMSTENEDMVRHEALPPLDYLDPRYLNFDPLCEYLSAGQNDSPGQTDNMPPEPTDNDALIQEKPRISEILLARKQLRERMLAERARRRDPLQRLRSLYRQARQHGAAGDTAPAEQRPAVQTRRAAALLRAGEEERAPAAAAAGAARPEGARPDGARGVPGENGDGAVVAEAAGFAAVARGAALEFAVGSRRGRLLAGAAAAKREDAKTVIYEWDLQSVSSRSRFSDILSVGRSKFETEDALRQSMAFPTSPGVTLLVNNFVANKVTGRLERSKQNLKFPPLPAIHKGNRILK